MTEQTEPYDDVQVVTDDELAADAQLVPDTEGTDGLED